MLSQSGARYGETSPGFTWVCAHYLISLIISVADGSEGGIASQYGQNPSPSLCSVGGAPKPVDSVHRDMEQRPLEYVSFPFVPSILIFNWFSFGSGVDGSTARLSYVRGWTQPGTLDLESVVARLSPVLASPYPGKL